MSCRRRRAHAPPRRPCRHVRDRRRSESRGLRESRGARQCGPPGRASPRLGRSQTRRARPLEPAPLFPPAAFAAKPGRRQRRCVRESQGRDSRSGRPRSSAAREAVLLEHLHPRQPRHRPHERPACAVVFSAPFAAPWLLHPRQGNPANPLEEDCARGQTNRMRSSRLRLRLPLAFAWDAPRPKDAGTTHKCRQAQALARMCRWRSARRPSSRGTCSGTANDSGMRKRGVALASRTFRISTRRARCRGSGSRGTDHNHRAARLESSRGPSWKSGKSKCGACSELGDAEIARIRSSCRRPADALDRRPPRVGCGPLDMGARQNYET